MLNNKIFSNIQLTIDNIVFKTPSEPAQKRLIIQYFNMEVISEKIRDGITRYFFSSLG